jgi:hypothetical protein
MYQPSRMQVVQCFGHLIEDKLPMSFGQDILPDECEEVDVHMFEDEVDISIILSSDDFFQFDDVGVGEFHQEHDFSVGALRVGRVIEGIEIFLEGFDPTGFLVGYLPDVSVGAAADLLVDIETG